MGTMDLSFTGVKRPEFTAVPEGEYVLKLVGCKPGKGKTNPENTVCACTYEVVGVTSIDSEFSGSEEELIGKKVFNHQTIAGPSADMGYVKLWLEALTGQELDGDFVFDPDQLLALECSAFVGVKEDYKDDTKEANFIKYFIAPDFNEQN